VYNSKKWFKVLHVWACDVQLLNWVQSYEKMCLWCITLKNVTKLCTLVMHNFIIHYEVVRVLACSAQLFQMTQSYACLDLWCTTHKNGTKLCTRVMVHNSEIRYKVTHLWACCAQHLWKRNFRPLIFWVFFYKSKCA